MAKGILGDDGPSLWMFIAVVLMWGAFKTWFSETKKGVKDTFGIGHNTAGPLQSQSTADIERLENQVKSWHVQWSALTKPKTYYDNIADQLEREMLSPVNIDEEKLIALCRGLNKNELMAVAVCYGVKETTFVGLTTSTVHIFGAFDFALSGMFKKAEMAEMKRIWAPTRLW